MLAALRIRLSQLETSDDLLDDCFMKLVQFYLHLIVKILTSEISLEGEKRLPNL